MEAYEDDFYREKNLDGCVWGTKDTPRILCFKDPETNTIGRIVLYSEDDPFENIGRSVVFADANHRRQITHDPFSNTQAWTHIEKIGSGPNTKILFKDAGQYECLRGQDRQKVSKLISKQPHLMEGHKGILKGALGIFDNREMPNRGRGLLAYMMIKSYQHILGASMGSAFQLNRSLDHLRVLAQNASRTGIQFTEIPRASAYPLTKSENDSEARKTSSFADIPRAQAVFDTQSEDNYVYPVPDQTVRAAVSVQGTLLGQEAPDGGYPMPGAFSSFVTPSVYDTALAYPVSSQVGMIRGPHGILPPQAQVMDRGESPDRIGSSRTHQNCFRR